MWIGIISTIIAMIMLICAVNLPLIWAFMVGGVIIAFIVLFAQTSKVDERITMLEISNQRLLSRIDLMMDKIESKNLANLAKDLQKSVETSAESKKAEFRAHINESPTKPRESTFQSFESPRYKAESTESTQSKIATDSPQHKNSINATNGANSTNTAFSFEQFLAQKAMIILGGIFFVLAAYFCIKYAIEHNSLTPQVRIAGAMCFGALLFAIGFALDRFDRFAQRSAISARIAQTLIGVASVVEFFAIYGGYALYGFFGEVLSFTLLCVVSFGALKVFFVDTNSFSSLGKVALFVFMGVAFIGIAALYNRFVLKRE